AHHQENRNHGHGGGGDGAGQLVPEVQQGIGSKHRKRIVFRGTQVPVGTQQHARFFLRLRQMIVIQRRRGEAHSAARSPYLEIGVDWNDQEIVLRLAEDRALRFGHADDFKHHAFRRDGLSDGTRSRKKLVLEIVPDERHVPVAIILDLREKTSLFRLDIVDHRDIGRRALQADVFRYLRAAVHRDTASRADADLFGHGQTLAQKFVFLATQLGIAAQHFHVFLGVEAHHHDALHAVPIGAHTGDILRDVHVHARNYTHHGDQRGGRQNDSEQREKAAQFAAAQRMEGTLDRLQERRMGIHLDPKTFDDSNGDLLTAPAIHSTIASSDYSRLGPRPTNPKWPPYSVAISWIHGLQRTAADS